MKGDEFCIMERYFHKSISALGENVILPAGSREVPVFYGVWNVARSAEHLLFEKAFTKGYIDVAT